MKTSCVEFSLVKEELGFWSRLCREQERQHWLRVDFNKWQDEEESEDDSESDEASQGEESEEVKLEEGMAGLDLDSNCAWAKGLQQEEQFEWITDCYRWLIVTVVCLQIFNISPSLGLCLCLLMFWLTDVFYFLCFHDLMISCFHAPLLQFHAQMLL